MKRGLSKLFSTREPIQKRTKRTVRQRSAAQNDAGRLSQVKCQWKAKIEHIISQTRQGGKCCSASKECEHMFTFPFRTVDNSLHLSCQELSEFSHYSKHCDRHDAAYGVKNLASSIVIDERSVQSVAPGHFLDDHMMIFCLLWYAFYMSVSAAVFTSCVDINHHTFLSVLAGCVLVPMMHLPFHQISLAICLEPHLNIGCNK